MRVSTCVCVGGMVRKRQGSTYGPNSRGWSSELPHDMADKNKNGRERCTDSDGERDNWALLRRNRKKPHVFVWVTFTLLSICVCVCVCVSKSVVLFGEMRRRTECVDCI